MISPSPAWSLPAGARFTYPMRIEFEFNAIVKQTWSGSIQIERSQGRTEARHRGDFGSKTVTFRPILMYDRFACDNGHRADMPGGPSRANSRPEQVQQTEQAAYSITSSASCMNASESARPSAFAVLRLTTSSYLVGSSTGRLAGFAPFKILTTYAAAWRNDSRRT